MSFEFLNSASMAISEPDEELVTSKRGETRQRVLLRAQLHAVDRQSDVHVTDLSRSGLRGTTDIAVYVGQKIFISLDDVTHCSGTVRWTQDRRFGVKFCNLLEVLPTTQANDLGKLPGHQERAPRIATNLKAKISICSWSCNAKIRNVSKSGMMVEAGVPLIKDQQLLVNLSDGKILTADVRWVEGDRIGIQLASPISILRFTHGDLS